MLTTGAQPPPSPLWLTSPAVRRAPDALLLLVLGLERPLQVKVELALLLEAHLLHVADHALVHRLGAVSTTEEARLSRGLHGSLRDMGGGRGGDIGETTYRPLGLLLEVDNEHGGEGEDGGRPEGDLGGAGHGGRLVVCPSRGLLLDKLRMSRRRF